MSTRPKILLRPNKDEQGQINLFDITRGIEQGILNHLKDVARRDIADKRTEEKDLGWVISASDIRKDSFGFPETRISFDSLLTTFKVRGQNRQLQTFFGMDDYSNILNKKEDWIGLSIEDCDDYQNILKSCAKEIAIDNAYLYIDEENNLLEIRSARSWA